MTPEECGIVRAHMRDWTLADALCGDVHARRRLVAMVCGSGRVVDGERVWFQLSSRGIESGLGQEQTLVVSWKAITGHLATLPDALEREVRAAYAEHRRLWGIYCHSLHGPWDPLTSPGSPHRGTLEVVSRDAHETAREHMRDTLEPLLNAALTYTPPVTASQPDIFDRLAEVA